MVRPPAGARLSRSRVVRGVAPILHLMANAVLGDNRYVTPVQHAASLVPTPTKLSRSVGTRLPELSAMATPDMSLFIGPVTVTERFIMLGPSRSLTVVRTVVPLLLDVFDRPIKLSTTFNGNALATQVGSPADRLVATAPAAAQAMRHAEELLPPLVAPSIAVDPPTH